MVKSRWLQVAAVTVALALATGQASAKDMAGRLGVGADQTLGGASGAHLSYWLGTFGVNILFNYNLYSPDGGDSQSELQLGGGILYALLAVQQLMVQATANLNLGMVDRGGAGVQLALDGGIRAEYFVTDNLSFHTQVGLVLSIIPEEGAALNSMDGLGDTQGTRFSLVPSTLGSLGFTYYFN